MTLVARHAAVTDIGLHRAGNEDAYVDQPPLWAVADGMGGARAGEVASGLAVEALVEALGEGGTLADAVQAANERVYRQAGSDRAKSGMGTTLTAVRQRDDGLDVAHVGDSRLYRLRDGVLEQLTDDHSLVGEMVREGHLTPEAAQRHPQRSILSRALGTEPVVEVDAFAAEVHAGDVLLLCSDGLYSMVEETTMGAVLEAIDDPLRAARQLVREAKNEGGHDNITVIVVRFDEAGDEATEGAGAAGAAAAAESATAVLDTGGEVTAPLPLGDAARDEVPGEESQAVRSVAADADESAAAGEELPAAVDTEGEHEQGEPSPSAAESAAPADQAGPGTAPRRRPRRRLWLIVAVVVLLVAAFAIGAVLSGVYFVGVDNGMVSVYRGLPWSVGGVHLYGLYLRSTTPVDVVEPGLRRRVEAHELHRKAAALELARRAQGLP